MKSAHFILIVTCISFLAFTRCSEKVISSNAVVTNDTSKGLKDYYKNFFTMGVAVTPLNLKTNEANLIVKHFNSITAENAMKIGPIHPRENEYYWSDADSIVAFAKRHNMKMRGHTLVWHRQTPAWFFIDANNDTVTKEVLLQRLKDHITTVVNRYKGSIYAWDVVNEVIEDNDNLYMRNSAWYRISGEEFIAKAFEYAHAADPNALLFYNDYNTEVPGKRDKIYRLVKGLKDAGVPIHGVGLQGHWKLNNPSRENLEKSIDMFSSLGLQVQVTELDVTIQKEGDANATFTPEIEQMQIEQYKMVFEVFRQKKDKLSGITFWNVSDRHSWMDSPGRKHYPLLFDQNLQPKKVFWEVVKF